MTAPKADDLIVSAYTVGGMHGDSTFEQRVSAAAQAGFRKIGLTREQYFKERAAGRTDDDLRAIVAHHGVKVDEIEFLYGWAGTGDGPGFPGQPRVDWRDRERDLFQIADVFSPDHLNCGEAGFFGPLLPMDQIAERFAGIADRAKEHGLRVVLEPLAFAGIPDCATAANIVRLADRPNAGVLIDAWHFFRGNSDFQQLRDVPPEKLMVVQISDGKAPFGDPMHDATHARRPPGEGEFDLKGMLDLLYGRGSKAALSVEIMSDELAAIAPADVAKRVYGGTVKLLDTLAA